MFLSTNYTLEILRKTSLKPLIAIAKTYSHKSRGKILCTKIFYNHFFNYFTILNLTL